ncbi:MAG: PAS domain S-box protein, partial [Desulfatitalea sp.]|nr:PAS domain S-box protein [Desulfatitalea sp.]NNK00877.1 PAS domain S-box protein [Desulfatitalea sp.]
MPDTPPIHHKTAMSCEDALSLVEILNAMEDGIYITSSDYTVEFMNAAMIAQFGEGTGKKCYEVVNASEIMCPWCQAKEVFENGRSVQEEIYIPRQDKTYRIIEVPIRQLDGSVAKLNIYRDISRRKNQELELRAKAQDYRRLFENVAAGVYVSAKEGRFINANQALLDMLGYDRKEEFLNINIQQDLYVRPEDRIRFQHMIEDTGQVVNYAVDFKRKDGSTLPVLLTSHTRKDHGGQVVGYEGICVDQTQIAHMEQKVREARDFLHNIIQSSPNAIFGADMRGKVIIWNKGAEETIGHKAEDQIGSDVRRIYPEGLAYELMAKLRSNEYGGPGKLRAWPMTINHADGHEVEGTMSASIIYDDNGNEIASVGTFVDIGEQLEMERKLSRTQEQLLQSEKLAAMGRLTSQLAHELNNPLYGIMNTLELMKTEIRPDNKRRRLLEMSLSETVRLAEMLRKMLSFSKPDQEQRIAVDINTIIDEIMLLYAKQLREVDIKLALDFAPDLPPVTASKNQLRQVFLNMVSNAKDAMPDGGQLTFATSGGDRQVVVNITDTGTGIKPEHLDQIFDTFFTTKTESARGVGLGLSVCYGFIKDHGGD